MSVNTDNHNRYQYIIDNIKDIIWETDKNIVFTFVSPSIKSVTGYDVHELLGKSLTDFISKESIDMLSVQWTRSMERMENRNINKFTIYDVQFFTKSGDIKWFEVSVNPIYNNKDLIGYIGVSRDMTEKKASENELKKYLEELRQTNRKLEEMANYDILTQAYNTRKFDYYCNLAIEQFTRYGNLFSIIIFDIDSFKQVNDLYGHKKGDSTLQEMAEIVRHSLRSTDKLFRWGGDEFIVLLHDTDSKNAYKVAEKIRKSVESNDFEMPDCNITISLGMGDYKPGETPDQLVYRIDHALLNAKCNGRNRTEQG